MVFSSWMVAPRAASSLVRVCFSSRVTGGMGAGSSAEPPPAKTMKKSGKQISPHRGRAHTQEVWSWKHGVGVPPCGHVLTSYRHQLLR